MFRRQNRSAWCSRVVIVLAVLLAAPRVWSAPPAGEKVGNAIDIIPADATFYAASLRGKEQLQNLLASKAWAKVKNLQAVQMGWQAFMAQLNQPGSPWTVFQQLLQLPENQELLELVGDAVSSEVFLYGDESWLKATQLISELNAYRYRSAMMQLSTAMSGGPGADRNPEEENRLQVRQILLGLNSHLDAVKIPNVLVGFKIPDPAPAKRQIKRLEVVSNMLLGQNPLLKNRLVRGKIGENEFITLTLDGKLVPWDQVPFAKFEDQPGEFDKLKQKLTELVLVITLGVRDQHVLLSIGSTNEAVAKLGQGKTLPSLPEFKPLKKYSGERLTGIGYVSKSLQDQTGMTKADVDSLAALAAQYLIPSAPLDDKVKTRIAKDLKQLADDIKGAMAERGALMSFAFLNKQGYEQYAYNWGQNRSLDDSKPLTLVDHLGGTPMAAVLARSKNSGAAYAMLTKWIGILHAYFEEIGVPELPPQKRDEYMAVRDAFLPLIRRVDVATRTMLLPALADGQEALVLDTKIKSRRWHKQMPAAKDPLPMIEVSLVLGVSDAELLKKACAEYKSIADAALVKARELNPGKIPESFKIPDPVARPANKNGTVYTYPLPKDAGLDGQIAISAGLGPKVAVISLAPKHVSQLLTPVPLAADGVLAGAGKRPLAVISYFNWRELINAVEPWAEYGVRAANGGGAAALEAAGGDSFLPDETGRAKLAEVAEDSDQVKLILEHVRVVADVLKVIHTIGSVTYSENGAMVTHLECRMKDVD